MVYLYSVMFLLKSSFYFLTTYIFLCSYSISAILFLNYPFSVFFYLNIPFNLSNYLLSKFILSSYFTKNSLLSFSCLILAWYSEMVEDN